MLFHYMCVMNGNSFDYDADAEGCQDDAIVCYCVVIMMPQETREH